MGSLSFPLMAKITAGIGIVGCVSAISIAFINKEGNSNTSTRKKSIAEINKEQVLKLLSRKSCQEAYRSKKTSKFGALYICPTKQDSQRSEEINSLENLEGLWYLEDESLLENSQKIQDFSEVLKKVLSINYKEKVAEESEHILFKLSGEDGERKLIVNSQEGWQYFGTPATFKEMDTLLSNSL